MNVSVTSRLARAFVLGLFVFGLTQATVAQEIFWNPFYAPQACSGQVPTNMTADVLYTQIDLLCTSGSFSENYTTHTQFDNETADDFVVPPPYDWEVTQIEVVGGDVGIATYPTSYDITFYNDDSGKPGTVEAAIPNVVPTAAPATNPGNGAFLFDVAPVALSPGTYWLSVVADGVIVTLNPNVNVVRFQWHLTADPGAGVAGIASHFRNAGGVQPACTGPAWFNAGPCYGVGSFDVSFAVGGSVLPVELVSFEALRSEADVVLSWKTASETNNAGFDVQHARGSENFTSLGFMAGHGTTLLPQNYSFRVADAGVGVHRFRLKQVDYDGAFAYSETVETFVGIPGQLVLEPAYPNPFNPSTTLRFAVANGQQVRLELHDATGRMVRSVFSGVVTADDMHNVTVDASGLSSGLYIAVLTGESVSMSRRLLLSK